METQSNLSAATKPLFSVYDSKAELYMPPVTYRTRGEAIRSFQAACEDKQSQFHKYPSDFTLVEIGSFIESSGLIVGSETPTIVVNASDFVSTDSSDS